MKGFPNQIADLKKLAAGMRCFVNLIESGQNATDDGIFGEALVRARVAGTGHEAVDIDVYLRDQQKKPRSGQAFRTTARGLRELFHLLLLIDYQRGGVLVSDLGQEAATFAGAPLNFAHVAFWRGVVRNLAHNGGDDETSHPYQVLLRLVHRVPGIPRAKCALALEARNDSDQELNRIEYLASLSEPEIRETIGVSESNWDNAKKVLPSFAEQLGDVNWVRRGHETTYTLADAPGDGQGEGVPRGGNTRRAAAGARRVTPDTIGRAGTVSSLEERIPQPTDPADAAHAVAVRYDRLRRHNLIVQALARRIAGNGVRLFENPFDILAIRGTACALVEVKSLDGTEADQRDRVMEALAQLLYYEPFAAKPLGRDADIRKIACFEAVINHDHMEWLNGYGIGVLWCHEGQFSGDELAEAALRLVVGELH